MKKASITSSQAVDLKQRAEAKLAQHQKGQRQLPSTEEETLRLIHELEVHQTELEIQNESLIASNAEMQNRLNELNDFYDNSPAGCLTLSAEGIINQTNQSGARMLGLTHEQLINRHFEQFLSLEQRPVFKTFLKQVFSSVSADEVTCEIVLGKPVTAPLFVQIKTSGAEGKMFCKAVMIDISDRKQAENRLEHLENHFKTLIENAPDGIILINRDNQFNYASPAVEKLFGYPLQELLRADPLELTHPDDRSLVLGAMTRLIQNPAEVHSLQYRFLHKNGTWRWIESTFKNLLAEAHIEAVVVNIHDIHEQKMAQALLEKKQNSLETILSITHIGSFEFEPKTEMITWSTGGFQFFDIDPSLGRIPLTEFLKRVHPEDRSIL